MSLARRPALTLPEVQLALRASLAAGLSLMIAQALHLQFPLYAILAAVLVTDLEPEKARRVGLDRVTGTVIGAIFAAVVGTYLGPGAWEVAFGILASMLLTSLLGMGDAARVAGFVCGIGLLNHGERPWRYVLHRTAETLVGVTVATVVSQVPKLWRVRTPRPVSR